MLVHKDDVEEYVSVKDRKFVAVMIIAHDFAITPPLFR